MHNKPIALIILDGFGISHHQAGNAVALAHMPYFKHWLATMPHATLAASGAAVGLPDGVVGNSEVGHYTIGAGRIVEQPTTMIDRRIADGSFYTNPVLSDACKKTIQTQKQFHIIGLLSDAQIHGSQAHIVASVKAAHEQGIKTTYIHALLDGQDSAPYTAQDRLSKLAHDVQPYGGTIVTIQGRFYALDGNKNYERTLQAYRLFTDHAVSITQNWQAQLYPSNSTENFCEPMRIQHAGYIEAGDTVLFTSCRADHIRQLVLALAGDPAILGKQPPVAPLTLLSPVSYGTQIPTQPLYTMPQIHHTLKEVLCAADRTIFSIAETKSMRT
jgi:2,3-bisphosphoglycerate-independent phosphoglycerate mutase